MPTLYFSRFDANPDSPTYRERLSLHRSIEEPGEGRLWVERWDRKKKEWVDHPELLLHSGVGGADDYMPTSPEEALALLRQWGIENPEAALNRAPETADEGKVPDAVRRRMGDGNGD